MENASKALIIAGAILLSIVLITLGVVIIGRGQETVDQANIDDQVVSTWNQKWTQYEGKELTGTTVNNLLNSIISSNATAAQNEETEKVIYMLAGESADVVLNTSTYYTCYAKSTTTPKNWGMRKINTYATPSKKYSVKFNYNAKGYVCNIVISAA